MNEEIEKLEGKIEEDGQLYIPQYVYKRVNDCIADFGYSCSETDINDAWKELKRSYAEGGNTAAGLYRTECHIVAYLRYYFFLNYPAIKWILLKNLEKGTEIIPGGKGIINILDYGAGPGTASMAICDFLKDAKENGVYENTMIKLYFDEMSGLFSKRYRKMLRGHEMMKDIKYVFDGGQNGYKKSFYDIIIISYALNELSDEMREWVFHKARDCLKDGGYLIIIESAYKNARRYIGGFLNLTRGSFKIIDASGPLCSLQSCKLRDKCFQISIKRKDLKIPDGMTEEMKRFFEGERKRGKIKRKSADGAENIILCNGLGRGNLAFWEQVIL